MSLVPDDLKYTKDHEWVRVAGDQATVGVTDHAQKQLGDIVYVELPKAGDRFEASDSFGSIESVKAVAEVYAPVSGSVAEINDELNSSPESVNDDPYGEGWLVKINIEDAAQLDGLLTPRNYEVYISEEAAE